MYIVPDVIYPDVKLSNSAVIYTENDKDSKVWHFYGGRTKWRTQTLHDEAVYSSIILSKYTEQVLFLSRYLCTDRF